jgi:galactose mutarotase-like enzyme
VTETRPDSVSARLEWSTSDLLKIFPFSHDVELAASIQPDGLTLKTTLVAGSEGAVPVSFGFHPYLRIPELSRANWVLELPAMRKLLLDSRGIPTGDEESFGGFNGRLDESSFDDGFALMHERTSFTIAGARRRISVDLLEGYRYTQVFAPKDKDYIALEPMTAPTSALTSGRGLRLVNPGERFRAVFRIRIDAAQ